MPYIANQEMRHGGKLYEKGDEIPLKYEEAQEYMKHGAVTRQSKATKPSSAPEKPTGNKTAKP
jgi:rubrerythrin